MAASASLHGHLLSCSDQDPGTGRSGVFLFGSRGIYPQRPNSKIRQRYGWRIHRLKEEENIEFRKP